jgi:hypothetical protein
VRDRVDPIRMMSTDAVAEVAGPIDLLFIDGSHVYEDVRRDYEDWAPKVRAGGCIAFHDSWHMTGPHRATAEILLSSRQLHRPRLVDTITAATKVDDCSALDRAINGAFLLGRLPRGALGFARLTWGGGTRLERVASPG